MAIPDQDAILDTAETKAKLSSALRSTHTQTKSSSRGPVSRLDDSLPVTLVTRSRLGEESP